MSESELTEPTYRYVLRVDGKVVYHGLTTHPDAKLRQHKRRYPRAEMEQVGEPTTRSEAYEWVHSYPTGTDPLEQQSNE